ncbi:MAG: dicarboxylate/amino acid:cation symporter [Alphaproteobacteria bacterium]|nr:dicarboxylate/amino acid:cation symporter [Alphaproteobacteria bacterium]
MYGIILTLIHSLKHRSVQVLLVLILYLLLANLLPSVAHQFFYTISLLIKDILVWVMPVTVGLFIAYAVRSFEHKAPLFVVALLLFEGFSNLSSVWYAYVCASFAADNLPSFGVSTLSSDFMALWRLPLSKPSWWSAEKGAIVGLTLGCMNAFSKQSILTPLIAQGKDMVEWMLTQVFARLIPLFILGFAVQMYQTHLLDHIFTHYAVLVLWLVLFLIFYLFVLFTLGAGYSLGKILLNIKNLLPAGGIALTSGCSLSTMPWTIAGTAKNLRNPSLAQAIIPATTNIQQIGDCIANTFLCFLIYRHFYGENPDLITWAHFSFVFVLARFATAAVIGGAIFIMLPIYETYLDFNPEMIAIILALNVFLDPLITSCNVMANGALCRVFERVWGRILTLSSPNRFHPKA